MTVVPHTKLTAEALHGVVEEFVTREGTDYGGMTVALEKKVAQVMAQLVRGDAVIVYDHVDQRCNILSARNGKPIEQ